MIRLLLDPPRFECETAADAAALAKLMGIGPVPAPTVSVYTPLNAKPAPVNREPVVVSMTAASVNAPKPRAGMKPSGKKRTCKKCGLAFPVINRSDCASVYCPAHRTATLPRKNPKPATPAAGRMTRAPRVPTGPHTTGPESCSACGATVPQFELINGECLQCAPIGARKARA